MLNVFEYVLLVGVVFSSLNVLFVANPVQSLLWLIFLFLLLIIEFLVLGVEFVALLFLMIYIGAIAVLFLFVIMMLNVRIVELSAFYLKYVPIGSFIFIFFFLEIYFFLFLNFKGFFIESNYKFVDFVNLIYLKGNVYLLGNLIYTYFGLYFCLIGIILFIALLGSIVLIMYLEKRTIPMIYLYKKWDYLKYYKI